MCTEYWSGVRSTYMNSIGRNLNIKMIQKTYIILSIVPLNHIFICSMFIGFYSSLPTEPVIFFLPSLWKTLELGSPIVPKKIGNLRNPGYCLFVRLRLSVLEIKLVLERFNLTGSMTMYVFNVSYCSTAIEHQ